MPYVKQTFVDHETKLSAAHLEYIEDGIVNAFAEIPKFVVKTISLPAANWTGSGSIYSQVVEMTGVTSYSKVDLLPSPEQLHELLVAEISLTSANSDGSITVFAIGAAPTSDYQMQALVTEVIVETKPDDTVTGGTETEPTRTVVMAETEITGFSATDGSENYSVTREGLDVTLTEGANYVVVWDDEEYTCTAGVYEINESFRYPYLGNPNLFGWGESTDEKFFICPLPTDGSSEDRTVYYTSDTSAASHRVTIYLVEEVTEA